MGDACALVTAPRRCCEKKAPLMLLLHRGGAKQPGPFISRSDSARADRDPRIACRPVPSALFTHTNRQKRVALLPAGRRLGES
ncbi:hypothetical protein MRX96_046062 [Rhipicephalus microplus]